MKEKKKHLKDRAEKYEKKLVIDGTLDEVLKVSIPKEKKILATKFTIKEDVGKFNFELDEDGKLWYIDSDNIKSGFVHAPPESFEDAKQIAFHYIESQGFLK